MKSFQIKQKFWSLSGSFTVSDQYDIPTYQVEGSFFQLPKTFTIRDMEGNLVSQIEKELFTFLPKFKVSLADGSAFSIEKEFTFLKDRYSINGLDMEVRGDFWDMNFDLVRDGQQIARITQEWFRLTSTYQIDVLEEAYADLVISLVIAIDYVKEQEHSSH